MTNYSKITALYSCLSVGDEDRDGGVKMHIRIDYRNSGKLKPVERRLATLKKHLEQSDIYFKYKGKKKLTEAEQIRKSVYSILRQEQRELAQHRTQDMER